MAKQFDRKGNVLAHDFKYTGDEPVWTEDMTQEEFMKARTRMLGFYNYYLDKKSLLPDVNEFIKRDYPDVKIPQSVLQAEIPFTVMKLMRAVNRGMWYQTEETDDYTIIANAVSKAERVAKDAAKIAKKHKQPVEQKDSPVEKKVPEIDPNVQSLLCDLDQMYDKWVLEETKKPVGINLGEIVKAQKIKRVNPLIDWLQANIDELHRALNKTDEFAIEGYKYLNKPQLRKWIKVLEEMRDSVKTAKRSKKKTVRKKKVKTPAEQTKHLKYLGQCPDTTIESLDVASIIGAQTVVLYNAKYRDVNVLKCTSGEGFSVKGQAVQDVADTSFAVKLRKPEEDLKPIKEAKNPLKHVKDNINSKPKKFNPRFNDNVMVIYAK